MRKTLKNVLIVLFLMITAFQYVQIENQQKALNQTLSLSTELDSVLFEREREISEMNSDFTNLLQSLEFIRKVDVTMYNAVEHQTDDTPFITASGARIDPTKATEHRWIAISRDLQKRWGGPLNFGDVVYVKGTDGYDGLYKVNDNMNPRYTNRIDILRTEGDESFAFIGEGVELYRVKENTNFQLVSNSEWDKFHSYVGAHSAR